MFINIVSFIRENKMEEPLYKRIIINFLGLLAAWTLFGTPGSQEQPGAARRSQGEPVGARRSQEEPPGTQEEPGRSGGPRRSQS